MIVIPEEETLLKELCSKAKNLFENRKFCCSESVLSVFNFGFNGGLSREAIMGLSAGFCGGVGGAGCLCGALSGSTMALGLFVGPHLASGLNKKDFKQLIKKLHDQFRNRFGSTCCRLLIENFSKNSKEQHNFCKEITSGAVELTGRKLLEVKADLKYQVNTEYLRSRDSKITGLLKNIV